MGASSSVSVLPVNILKSLFVKVKEDQQVGWHHRLNGHESEQTPGDSGGQRSLVCCSPWGHKESGTT